MDDMEIAPCHQRWWLCDEKIDLVEVAQLPTADFKKGRATVKEEG